MSLKSNDWLSFDMLLKNSMANKRKHKPKMRIVRVNVTKAHFYDQTTQAEHRQIEWCNNVVTDTHNTNKDIKK